MMIDRLEKMPFAALCDAETEGAGAEPIAEPVAEEAEVFTVPDVEEPKQEQIPVTPQPQLYPVVTMGNWIRTLLIISLLPMALNLIGAVFSLLGTVGLIVALPFYLVGSLMPLGLALYFAFSKKVNPSKRNFFKAYLIIGVIAIVLVLVLSVALAVLAVLFADSYLLEELLWQLESIFY